VTGDPMDSPPDDHGSDRFDYAEVDAPEGVGDPRGAWFEAIMAEPCADCRANVFFRWIGSGTGLYPNDPSIRYNWSVTVAHDDGCPRLEAESR
jgi:hypothetical protein